MGKPWLRLNVYFYADSKVIKAGPDAGICFPAVLAVLKREDGVASDDDLDPVVLARLIGGNAEMWGRALEGLKKAGLLVPGTREIRVGRADPRLVSGWVTPHWDEYQPDCRPKSTDRKERPRDLPSVPETAGRSPGDGTGRDGTGPSTTRTNGDAISPLPPVRGAERERARASRGRERAVHPDASAVLERWEQLAGRLTPLSGQAETDLLSSISDHLGRHGLPDILVAVDYVAQQPYWRGKTAGEPIDLFRDKPITWAAHRTPKNRAGFTSRVDEAREWHARGRPALSAGRPRRSRHATYVAREEGRDTQTPAPREWAEDAEGETEVAT